MTLSAIKGLLRGVADTAVSFVNADQLMAEHNVEVIAEQTPKGMDFVSLLSIEGGGHSLSATLMGLGDEPRIVQIDGYKIDMPPATNMLLISNTDAPGVIGRLGTIIGDASVNIANMEVGLTPDSSNAMMVVSLSERLNETVVAELRAVDEIMEVVEVNL